MRPYRHAVALLAALFALPLFAGDTAPKRKEIRAFTPSDRAFAATLALRRRFAKDRVGPNEKDRGKLDALKKELQAIDDDMLRVVMGGSLLEPDRDLLMGFYSDLDDSEQPYSLYIPREYDAAKPSPLVVLLHGQQMFNPLQCRANRIGTMLVLAPQGRGGMDYMYVGEDDVLRSIQEVQGLLNVDPNRIYLAGASMGGTGSWHLGVTFPDRFAGIMPICGNTDCNVWEERWQWCTPKDSPLAKVRHFLREDTCSITYAANLLNLGVVSLQGESDNIVNELHARHMADALKATGHPNFKIHMLPFVMHSMSVDYAKGLEPFVRNPKPARVHYKTAWLRYPGAYWLKITGIEKRLKHAEIDGVVNAGKKTIEIKTSNVTSFVLHMDRLPPDVTLEQCEANLDGTSISMKILQRMRLVSNDLCFTRDREGRWTFSGSLPAHPAPAEHFPPPKTASVEGPAEHAFMSRFVVVSPGPVDRAAEPSAVPYVPPEPDPLRAAIEKSADEFGALWKFRFAVPCRRKAAKDITPQDIADSNLILIGTPDQNPLMAQVVRKLPISFEPDDSVHLGAKLYTGPNLGLALCYPNPLNPNRYVVLIAGTTPAAYADIHVRFGNWFDWIPYDFRKHYDFAIFDDQTNGHNPETFLVWGFFDEQWQLAPDLTFEGIPAWRSKSRPRVMPDVLWNKQQPPWPGTLHLDRVAARNVTVNKEYLERNRTLQGGPLQLRGEDFERGLCCRFPCSLTFDCAGYKRLKLLASVQWDGKTEPSDDRKTFEKVRVTVHADGKQIFEALEQTYKDAPCEIDVELKGAKTITLSANGGLPWLNGSFIFANARLEGREDVDSPQRHRDTEKERK